MTAARVLIVEDDATLRRALCDTIEFGGYQVIDASNGKEALVHLERESVDLVISDVQMDEMDGTELLQAVRRRSPQLPFVMMTAHGSVRDAVQAMRDGATDYLQKPFEAEVLLDMVSRMESQIPVVDSGEMVAEDPVSKRVLEVCQRVAASDATVLVSGESGTGKEVLARAIHRYSARADGPFIALNCAAIPENMLEAILFGYEKGAFTGAYQARPGKFEQANGGTLLLDEISEMALDLQAKLLRVLQEREVERLGGNKLIALDVRVVATTNRILTEEVAAGRFREDLYYRLNVFPIALPPLRERVADILPLAARFLARHAGERRLVLGESAKQRLLAHPWRGNVRELDNCMQRAAILATGEQVDACAISFDETPVQRTALPTARAYAETIAPSTAQPTADAAKQPALGGDLKLRERELILDALHAVRGNRKLACERLGISGRTLRYKLAKFREEGIVLPGDSVLSGALQ